MKKILKTLVLVTLFALVVTAFTACSAQELIDKVTEMFTGQCQHEVVTDPEVLPTCTAAGLTEGYHCSKCDEVILPQYEKKALGHKIGTEGKEATCTEAAVCGTCEQSFGEPLGHDFADATCVAPKTCKVEGCGVTEGNVDPENHTWVAATCTEAKLCSACGTVDGAALGHDWADATCTAPKTCKVEGCGATEGEPLGHTFVEFVTVVPTADAVGYTIGKCSVEGCEGQRFDDVKAMGAGSYVLDMTGVSSLNASGDAFDGQVVVLGDWFAAHLSAKYRTDLEQNKEFDDGFVGTVRMNWGGSTAFSFKVGEEDKSIIRNGIEFTTLGYTTVKVHWVCGGDGRQLAIYDLEGNIVAQTNLESLKNGIYVSELVLPAGSYVIGNKGGSNYYFAVEVTVGDIPAADSELTLPAANTIGGMQVPAEGKNEAYTEGKYYVSGVITEIKSTQYGNMTIVDEHGNTFYLYGLYTDANVRYDSMETRPVVGDTIKVYGIIGNYKGNPQMKEATLIDWKHEHKWADATCTAPKTCDCKATDGEALGHDLVDGQCSRCEYNENVKLETLVGTLSLGDFYFGAWNTSNYISKVAAADAAEMTIEFTSAFADGKATAKLKVNGEYVGPAASGNKLAKSEYEWVVVKGTTDSGEVTYKFLSADEAFHIAYNTSSPRFSKYAAGNGYSDEFVFTPAN